MDSLPPIPSPAGQHWREFRFRVFPIATFLVTLGAVVMIWRQYISAPTLLGEVEVVRENVTSPKTGLLVQLNVTSFQNVRAGDAIAQVITTDPKILAASLGVIQAEIESLRIGMGPVLVPQRNAMSYARLRLKVISERAKLAVAKANLQLAEITFQINSELFKDKIISALQMDRFRVERDKFKVEVEELSKLVEQLEGNLAQLQLPEDSDSDHSFKASLGAAITVQEEKLRRTEAELSPILLKVPMDGMVSTVYRRSGETIMAGEPILTISSPSSGRIIGFLRQPLTFEPKVDMPVEVRSRSSRRHPSQSKILQVGAQMEAISAPMLPSTNPKLVETGLPILVGLPADLNLLPGELVEITIRPPKR